MKPLHCVIIGNGVSANRAADVLRENDPDARITIVSSEFCLFYFRHKLPGYITGSIEENSLIVHPIQYYKDKRIRLRLGQIVRKLDPERKVLYLDHMEKLHYDKLLICSGGKPHVPEIYYPYRSLFKTLKTLTDARELRQMIPQIRHAVLVGGDLTSMRLADALVKSGREVSMILDEYAFWPIESGPVIRKALEEALPELGVRVISGDPVSRIEMRPANPPVFSVTTRNGKFLESDLVGAFFGFRPDIDFLIRSGLDIDRGILVDDRLRTSYADVYAAGDCAQVYASHLNNYWVSIGWKNAIVLGEIAAVNMLGDDRVADMPLEQQVNFNGMQLKTSWWQAL